MCLRFVPLALALAGCGGNVVMGAPPSNVDAGAVIASGRALWATREPTCAAYHYDRQVTVLFASTGVTIPASGVITVQIVDDQPQWRWYIGNDLATPAAGAVDWFEDMAMLGAHSGAPPASTVEQLWDECESELAGTTGGTLMANEDGVPMTCLAFSQGCSVAVPPPGKGTSDVCQAGITLLGFSCGTLMPPAIVGDDGGADGGHIVVDASLPDAPPDLPTSE
jgi:hypothetical protein